MNLEDIWGKKVIKCYFFIVGVMLSVLDLVIMVRERKCILCYIVYSLKKVIIVEGEFEV